MSALDEYLADVQSRLLAEGFNVRTDDVQPFRLVAERSAVDWTTFGTNTAARIGFLPSPTANRLIAFSSAAFKAAIEEPRTHATWLGQGVLCCALAVVERAPADLMELVRRRPGPTHWSATERLALFDLAAGDLAVYSGRPVWGFAYAKSQRSLQERLFAAG